MPEEFSLYNGEVVLSFAEKSHRYKVSDNESKPEHCPSVTTILGVLAKPALVEWGIRVACDYVESNLKELVSGDSFSVQDVFRIITQARTAHDRARMEAADIGTSVHDWLANWWREALRATATPYANHYSLTLPEEEKARKCVQAALKWFSEHELKPVRVEEAQYSRLHKFCGRPDFIGYVDGTLSVLDYKSTRNLYPEVALQMSAYATMHQEEFGELPETRYGLRLDKETGEFEARCYKPDTFARDWKTFEACFLIYDTLKHLRRKPKKEDYLAEL